MCLRKTLTSQPIENGQDLSQACNNCGITTNKQLGEAEGLIGILTNGRVTRLDYTMQGLKCCFIPLENKQWFWLLYWYSHYKLFFI